MRLLKTFGKFAAEAALEAAQKAMEEEKPEAKDDGISEAGATRDKQAEEPKKAPKDFVKALSGGKISTDDLRRLREGLKKIPALHGQAVTNALLDTSVFAIQMGQATVLITYSEDEGLMANAMKMESISVSKANEVADANKFSSMVIRKGETEDEPNLHLVINKELLNSNRRKIASEFIAKGISLPDDNIPGLDTIVSCVTSSFKTLSKHFSKDTPAQQDIETLEETSQTEAYPKPKDTKSPWQSEADNAAPK